METNLDEGFNLVYYYPIFIYLVVIIGFAISALVVAHFLGPRKNTAVKNMTYESGMDPVGSARQRFDIKYYLIAIMFLVFDVELLFLYPWVVAAYQDQAWLPVAMQRTIFCSVLVFLGLLAIAYIYDLKKGVFRWR
ncbi:MAG: NADH-quinone oxidoreductase subunit A [Gemmataceae bacterium]